MGGDRVFQHVLVFGLVFFMAVGASAGMVTVQRHHELTSKLDIATPPACQASEGGGDSCEQALAHPEWGKLFGVSVAAWGAGAYIAGLFFALLLALALALRSEGLLSASLGALSVVAMVMIGGTLLYLIVGLFVIGTKCGLCLTMHAINGVIVTLIGISVFSTWKDYARRSYSGAVGAGAALFALVLYGGAAFAVDSIEEQRFDKLEARSADLEKQYGGILERACPVIPCPEELVFPLADMPDETASVVLAKGAGEKHLVEMLDMSCEACQDQHRFLTDRYRTMMQKGDKGMGLRLVLWSANRDCNPHTKRRLHFHSCSANAGLICAARAGGPEKALAYMEWEFSAENLQAHTLPDRMGWLEKNVSVLAPACLKEELSNGTDGRLARHATAGKVLAEKAKKRAECGPEGKGWWCFNVTPSFGVFTDAPYGEGTPADEAVGIPPRTKAMFLRGCPPPAL